MTRICYYYRILYARNYALIVVIINIVSCGKEY